MSTKYYGPYGVSPRRAGKLVRTIGNGRLPRAGYIQRLRDGSALGHDSRGYYLLHSPAMKDWPVVEEPYR